MQSAMQPQCDATGVADEEVLVAMLANELSNFAPPSIGKRWGSGWGPLLYYN